MNTEKSNLNNSCVIEQRYTLKNFNKKNRDKNRKNNNKENNIKNIETKDINYEINRKKENNSTKNKLSKDKKKRVKGKTVLLIIIYILIFIIMALLIYYMILIHIKLQNRNVIEIDNNNNNSSDDNNNNLNCSSGYYIPIDDETSPCLKCRIENCEKCIGTRYMDFCIHCRVGFQPFYEKGIIQSCSNYLDLNEQCLEYENKNNCKSCNNGFFLSFYNEENRKCQICPIENCKQCFGSIISTICLSCNNGYYLVRNNENKQICKKCSDEDCEKCVGNKDFDICVSCQSGFYPVYENNIITFCSACNDKCLTCDEINDKCSSCVSGYFLPTDDELKKECLKCSTEHCNKCEGTKSNNTCIECLSSSYITIIEDGIIKLCLTFKEYILYLKNKYEMAIPEDDIDETFEEAKENKRMYAFKENKNYLRFDEKGKSYILICHFYDWFWKKDYYNETKNLMNSYDGTSPYLIYVWYIEMHLDFRHVKPGNYKLYINEGFTNNSYIIEQTIIKVYIGEKVVYSNDYFPNSGENQILAEHFICDIILEDFDLDKLDDNGDAVINVEVRDKSTSNRKYGWIFDGYRLLEVN